MLEGVELLRPCQRLGFGDAGLEALPADHSRDGAKGVLLALAGGDQRGADAGIQAHLVVDGSGVGLERAGLAALGLAEYAAHQPVEQVDGGVGQAGAEVQADGRQRGMAALPLVAGNVLHRDARRLARELGQPGLVDYVPAAGLDAEAADVLQPCDQAQHGGRLGGLRHLPQPGQPALAGVLSASRQRVEPFAPLGRQAVGQAAVHLPAALVAEFGAQPLQRRRRRHHDATVPAGLHHQLG